jgi:hypothetical protein
MTGLLPPRRTIVLAAPLLALMACESATGPRDQGPATLVASAEISLDAQDLPAGFYFLPPMAKKPSHGGVFDAGASPVVEVCASMECALPLHASFSMTEGTGSERLRLEEEDERYIVNWHTGHTGAAAGQTYRVRVLVDDLVLGYADVVVVSTGREAVTARMDGSIALIAGQTLPVAFRIETGLEPITYLSIVGHAPAADATGIDIATSISVTFSAAVDASSLTAATMSLQAGSEEISLTGLALSEGGTVVTAQPDDALDYGTTYTVTIKGGSLGVLGDDGSTIAADSAWSFTTEGAAGATYTVVVSPALATVAVGGTQQFTAVVKDAGDDVVADPDVTWTTDDPAVATVDAAGLASGVAKGEATITAEFEGVQAHAVLTVRALPVVVITSPAPDAVFEVGSSITFSGSATDSEGNDLTGSALVWSSDVDGEIGTGESVQVSTLSETGHVISLTATDAADLSASATVSLTVDAYAPLEDSFLVGSDGGRFELFDGTVVIEIPAGAVQAGVEITVTALEAPDVAGFDIIPGTLFEFSPAGITFDPPAQLTITFDPDLVPAGADLGTLYIYKLLEDGVLQMTETEFAGTDQLTTPLDGFSKFMVAMPLPGPIILTEVRILPDNREIPIAEFRSFRVIPLDQNGRTHHDMEAAWSTADAAVATVAPTTYRRAIVTGVEVGFTQVIVTSTFELGAQELTGEADVTVTGETTGLWVAGGQGTTKLATSPDGITWTARAHPTTAFGWGVKGVAYNGSMWVAVGAGSSTAPGTIATSGDGINWTAVAESPFTEANGVAWNGSMWVAVGKGTAKIATSTDGVNWTGRTAPFNDAGHGVAWGNNQWVAVGGGAAAFGPMIATSPDGITWTSRGRHFMYAGLGVAYNGSMWVATGHKGPYASDGGYPTLKTSTDGASWTARASQVTHGLSAVASNGALWVAVGNSGAGAARITTSANGLDWTLRTVPEGFTNNISAVAWNGSMWVAGGVGTGGVRLATSADGITWTVRTMPITTVSAIAWSRSIHIPY